MTAAAPQPRRAPVPPRVTVAGGTVPRLLDEEIGELLAKGARGFVYLVGSTASGLTTALGHLGAVFAGDRRLGLRDCDGSGFDGELVTVTAATKPPRGGVVLTLAPWTDDDVLAYLVHRNRGSAGAAFASWRAQPDVQDLTRLPALCRSVLDVLSARGTLDPLAALRTVLDERLDPEQRVAARAVALAHSRSRIPRTAPEWPLFAAPIVRGMLAAEALLSLVEFQKPLQLPTLCWSRELVVGLRHLLAAEPAHADRLLRACEQDFEPDEAPLRVLRQADALSVLCAAHPGFRPPLQRFESVTSMHLAGADLHGLELRGCLHDADLTEADLRCADLQGVLAMRACFERARLDAAHLDRLQGRRLRGAGLVAPRASLRACNLERADLRRAVFDGALLDHAHLGGARLDGASLREADLSHANLVAAFLEGADLGSATCTGANLAGTDLRSTQLAGATFDGVDCEGADLSGQELPGFVGRAATFRKAWLTGTRWPNAQLQGSTFADAGLAGVDWEGADLRLCDFTRAAFHLGSSRSGLVPGGIASEGTRTGFYTDESHEERFQAPEDVRKANLRGCDLRDARIDGCDFYLVDLRGALLDGAQRDWLRRCRAILDP